MKELQIKVDGMKCAGCESRIQNALILIEGIETVTANHIDGTVTIKGNNLEQDQIEEKLEILGFDIVKDEA